ncbi:MAG: exodeoxyribonuclease V subunit gamma, partial [Clostridiales bacterium]|nr:exodeoxyribonuclease V subunit gamma [Clostridiales bacterium]
DTEGAVLVTAGAGSGKTRLLTHRIAYLIGEKGVKPYRILAITFTNKAANEMRERLYDMIEDCDGLWVFTFHAMCVRILRRYIEKLGYRANFSIYGEHEKEQCVKKLVKEENDPEDGLLKTVMHAVSDAKSKGLSPDQYRHALAFKPDIDRIARLYAEYEKELKRCNALDYDDLLEKAYTLLRTDEEARDYYRDKFLYIHVDEFQDTNEIQYKLIKLLAAGHGNVFAVGDEDQSIYGWRGAKIANIFAFRDEFNCKVYKLEQNYRSTKSIVELANTIIKHNTSRLDKTLWTAGAVGAAPRLFAADSDGQEADFVVRTMNALVQHEGYSLSDFAVLMRINALSRAFEERMILYAVPHRVFGGFKFYERKEIKDLLAYIRVMVNHDDREAILRIINFPKRGIGPGSVQQLVNYSDVTGAPLYDVIVSLEQNPDLPVSLIGKILPFANVLKCLDTAYQSGNSVSEILRYVIKLIKLKEAYAEDTDENEARKSNIRELVHGAEAYEEANEGAAMQDYLQNVSLYSDTDDMSDKNNSVSLATIHSAKGLEFKVVFVVGLEEGTFPDSRKAADSAEGEEERRLMYVAITRARERLYLSYAKSRFRYGVRAATMPSRFLTELGLIKPEIRRTYEDTGRDGYRDRAHSAYGDRHNGEERPVYGARPAAPPLPAASIDEARVHAGTRVRHRKFGEGVVLSLDHIGDTCAEVEFPGVGKQTLMLKYAPLELVEE